MKKGKQQRPRKSKSDRPQADLSLSRLRSAITNGTALLADVDHRSAWMRRLRDLISGHVADLGGAALLSTAETSIIRRASMLELQMEMMETRFAENDGVATTDQLLLYQRTASSCRRLLESVGVKRTPRDISVDPLEYARTYHRRRGTDIDEVEEAPA